MFLLLFISIATVHAIATYTPTGTACTANDGTSNWNSWNQNNFTIRSSYITVEPGVCANGTTLYYPTTLATGQLGSQGCTTFGCVRYFFPEVTSVPFASCRLLNLKDPFNSIRVDYGYNALDGTTKSPEYWHLPGLIPSPNGLGVNGFPLNYISWGVHILQGYTCTFTCTDPINQKLSSAFTEQNQLYSDGYQSMCHPSNVNQTTLKCINPIINATAAPVCVTPLPQCKITMYPFTYLTFNNGTRTQVFNQTTDIFISPGTTPTAFVSSAIGTTGWNKNMYHVGTAPILYAGLFTSCPDHYISNLYSYSTGTYVSLYQNTLIDVPYVVLTVPTPTVTSCPKGYYGPTCLPCQPCKGFYEVCNDGVSGTGACLLSNVCDLRSTDYGVSFTFDPFSSTGACKPNVLTSLFNIIIHNPASPTGLTTIGSGIPNTNTISWMNQYGVVTYNTKVTMTIILNPSVVIDPTLTFCNQRGSVYGNFTFEHYIRYGVESKGSMYLYNNTANPNDVTGVQPRCECNQGFYGDQCQFNCTVDFVASGGKICNAFTGAPVCPINRYLLPNNTCSTTGCTFGTYGASCTQKCPRCDLSSVENGFGLYTRCEQDLGSSRLGKCVCAGNGYASPVRIISSNATKTVATIYPTCSAFHCGYPNLVTGAYCTSFTRGSCITSNDNTTSTCVCKPGYHGRYCEQQAFCTRGFCGGIEYQNRDCDCGVVWNNTATSLNALTTPIRLIGLVGDYWYRDNFIAYNPNIISFHYDTNLWLPMVLYNIPARSLSQAQYACYKYRPCDGLLTTQYNDGPLSNPVSGAIFYTPFSYDISSVTLEINTNASTNGIHNYSDLVDISKLWYQTINTSVTNKNQVSVWEIQRTLGYDCVNDELDARWYFFQNSDEIVNEYGYRYCDVSHRDSTGACCLKGGGDDLLLKSYCYPHWDEITTGASTFLFRTNLLDNPDPFILMAQRHYDEIGHRKRYPPRQSCDTWPTLYEETSQCTNVKDGCPLSCSGQGRCRAVGTKGTTSSFPHDYQCVCAKYSDTSDADQKNYYITEVPSGTNTKGMRRYVGYGCQLDLDPCINPNDPANNQYICNNNPARCIGLAYALNSTLATPGSISPRCDCDTPDSNNQIASGHGQYCELSRCGSQGCQVNSTLAACINIGGTTPSTFNFQCQCSIAAETGPHAWIGEFCNIVADSCISSRLDDQGRNMVCGGSGFGTCMQAGTGVSTTPNWSSSHSWCKCLSGNFTGTTCTTPVCTTQVVVPFHGTCTGLSSQIANCYRMWRGLDGASKNVSPCNISSCTATTIGGVPSDSGLPGSDPQDVCTCSEIWREPRTIARRLGYRNDAILTSTDNKVGLCYAKCPTSPELDPTAFCGGHGYCIDDPLKSNSPTTHASCVCDYGYTPVLYAHAVWGTQEMKCVPYCSQYGSIIDDRSTNGLNSRIWNDYVANPLTATKPTCSCNTVSSGYYNNPLGTNKTCIDYKCFNGGVWSSIGAGGTGNCICPTGTLWNPDTFCKTSTCEGNPANLPVGVVRGRPNPSTPNICDCADPFTWNSPSKTDCDRDLCYPNGDLVNTTLHGNIPDLSLRGSSVCQCRGLYSTSSGNCPNTGDYCHPYCQDSKCSFGGTPFFSQTANNGAGAFICNCPAPYQPPYCQNHNCGTHGVANVTIAGCTCTFGWTDSTTLGPCKQDPCQRPCTSGTSKSGASICGGVFNEGTHQCDCFDAWSGTYCTEINTHLATANCSTPKGIAISSTSCLCTVLWTGDHCEISRCVAPGSIPSIDPITGADFCICPTGYSGLVCDVLTVQDASVTDGSGSGSSSSSSTSSSTTIGTIIGVTVGSVVIAGLLSYYAIYPYLLTKPWFVSLRKS